jgi:hypothetical protein
MHALAIIENLDPGASDDKQSDCGGQQDQHDLSWVDGSAGQLAVYCKRRQEERYEYKRQKAYLLATTLIIDIMLPGKRTSRERSICFLVPSQPSNPDNPR